MAFRLFSEDFKDGDILPEAQVFNGMGYRGGNLSPQLGWADAPAGTQSFVVTMYDPDAPTGSGWWHWVLVNLPSSCHALPRGCGSGQGALPRGAMQTRTDFGSNGYGGAAPPPGESHHYVFTVHALKVNQIDVDEGSSGAMVGFLVHRHSLGNASLTARYGR